MCANDLQINIQVSHEKILKVTDHKWPVKSTYYTIWPGYEAFRTHTLLAGIQIHVATLESTLTISYKVKSTCTL
jgi:hypothetical protein